MSQTTATPLDITRARQQAAGVLARELAAGAAARELAARRRDTAKNGYRGPLTRAELARAAEQASDREQMRAILHMA